MAELQLEIKNYDKIDEKEIYRTQIRFPKEIYFSVRHVGAELNLSFNKTVNHLLKEALVKYRSVIPND